MIIDGGGIDRVFEICCQTNLLHLEYLTIRNGRLQPGRLGFYDHGHGAGIHNHGVLEQIAPSAYFSPLRSPRTLRLNATF